LREIIGVQHMKGLVFDDDVILTGANLSEAYFTNTRQDRYFVVRKSPELADFFENIIDTVGKYAYPLRPAATSGPAPQGVDGVKRAWAFRRRIKKDLESLFAPDRRISLGGLRYKAPSFRYGSHLCRGQQEADISASGVDWSSSDTWIFPLVQAGFAGVRQEEFATLRLLRHAARLGGSLHLTTPYLNLGAAYEHALANAGPMLDIQLLTASPEANGFFGSPGLSGSIPLAYSLLEHRTWKRLTGAAKTSFGLGITKSHDFNKRQLLEYARPGWEYHAKGIYWDPKSGVDKPAVTLVGSSNYGHRSLRRDLECQFLVATSHLGLRAALEREKAALVAHAHLVEASSFEGLGRTAGVVHRVAVRLLRSFL
jgi:CDP-diacylglycerol--glycerol-3-phosphate 3-phosphatidyltransferase